MHLRRGSVTGETEQSGISKAFDFLDTYQVLADKAQQTEDGFRRVLELYSLVDTGEVREVKVRLTRSFGVERTGELIEETKRLFELGISTTAALVVDHTPPLCLSDDPGDERDAYGSMRPLTERNPIRQARLLCSGVVAGQKTAIKRRCINSYNKELMHDKSKVGDAH